MGELTDKSTSVDVQPQKSRQVLGDREPPSGEVLQEDGHRASWARLGSLTFINWVSEPAQYLLRPGQKGHLFLVL